MDVRRRTPSRATIGMPHTDKETPMLPATLQTEFTLQATVLCDAPMDLGLSSRGHRKFIPIQGGRFEGPGIRGVVLSGGGDWQTLRTDGVLEIEARYTLQAEDGTLIGVHNRGLSVRTPMYVRTRIEFEAPAGAHEWLNRAVFVGTLQVISRAPLTVLVSAFKVV